MQMWEYMGRLMLDKDLVTRMTPLGRNDEAVYQEINEMGGHHMSRAEISDISGLLGQPAFMQRAAELGTAVRNALREMKVAEQNYATQGDLAPLREVIGLLCIDHPILTEINGAGNSEDVRRILDRYNFRLSLDHTRVVHRVLGAGGTGFDHATVIHAFWSAPASWTAGAVDGTGKPS